MNRLAHCRYTFRLAGVTVFLQSLAGACHDASPKELVLVTSVSNPEKSRNARLIKRVDHAALNNVIFYVDIQTHGDPPGIHATTNGELTEPALSATRAERLSLRWLSDSLLEIACLDCGVESVDVLESRARVHGVRIAYRGMPSVDAFDKPVPAQ